MIDFKIKVDDTRIKVMFDEFPKKLQANLKRTITELTDQLLVRVRAGEPRRTGRLRTETRRFVDERKDWIRGRVRVLGPGGRGHNIAAAALEYGAHGTFSVRGYRRNGASVGGYRRHANIAERRFLRGAAAGMRARVLAELQATIDETITEMNR
jgi:hypothetical protein